ncbi:wax ester/triacylglycerol synthase domain-containing protein [Nonomuraea sp. NPDC050404]|uniref:wax ester/triacylglycerol synthase domain-containing protein n=1 Tax=Nonomuraea sp. NPDC050404 TaxID=3155783 RepID=UPI0033EC5FE1
MIPHTNLWTRTFLGMSRAAADPSDLYFGFILRGRGPVPDVEELRRQVDKRLALIPALTRVPETREGDVTWRPDEAFDLAGHVRAHGPLTRGVAPQRSLLACAPASPPQMWGLWVLPGPREGRWQVCWLSHHAFGDAMAIVRILRVLFGDEDPPGPVASSRHRRSGRARAIGAAGRMLPGLLATYLPGEQWPPMTSPAGAVRGWAYAQVPFATLRRVADTSGATVNQVHLAAMTAALRGLETDNGRRPRGRLQACMPLDLRTPGQDDHTVASRLGLMRVPLAWARPNPAGRLAAVVRATRPRRIGRWKRAWRALLADAPEPIAQWAHRRIGDPRNTKLTVSAVNVPGALAVGGSPVTEIVPLPWLPPGHACFTLLATYAGTTTQSVLTHGGGFAPGRLTTLWARAVDDLAATYEGRPHAPESRR